MVHYDYPNFVGNFGPRFKGHWNFKFPRGLVWHVQLQARLRPSGPRVRLYLVPVPPVPVIWSVIAKYWLILRQTFKKSAGKAKRRRMNQIYANGFLPINHTRSAAPHFNEDNGPAWRVTA